MKCQDKTCCTCVNSSTCEEWKTAEKELDKYRVVKELDDFRLYIPSDAISKPEH